MGDFCKDKHRDKRSSFSWPLPCPGNDVWKRKWETEELRRGAILPTPTFSRLRSESGRHFNSQLRQISFGSYWAIIKFYPFSHPCTLKDAPWPLLKSLLVSVNGFYYPIFSLFMFPVSKTNENNTKKYYVSTHEKQWVLVRDLVSGKWDKARPIEEGFQVIRILFLSNISKGAATLQIVTLSFLSACFAHGLFYR